ncbi:hypothetical protein CARUB_v10018357mg [Capsella rubella]|uniref:Uncharacterized protein n=1 Tax=Capsella rubella TaxID=81985 RepID=R0FRY9_9BRAS|nr:hypothetical protein CARUB_v10018357mg [Capsella rubella]
MMSGRVRVQRVDRSIHGCYLMMSKVILVSDLPVTSLKTKPDLLDLKLDLNLSNDYFTKFMFLVCTHNS